MQRGFTLIELAVVLVVIGFILGGALKGAEIIENSRTQDLIKTTGDLKGAVLMFRQKYGFLPGDLPNAAAVFGGAGCNGNGNGTINGAVERNCARDELIASNLVRGTVGTNFTASQGTVITITNVLGSGMAGLPPEWNNVLLLTSASQSQNCDTATQLARALGDGNTQGGVVRTSVICAGQNATVQIPRIAVRIN